LAVVAGESTVVLYTGWLGTEGATHLQVNVPGTLNGAPVFLTGRTPEIVMS
jgi:hypothetical protein